ncbi:MAG: flagellar filament capping protein FliD [Sulfuricella sp.]
MDPLLGITANTPLIGIAANRAVSPTAALLSAELSLFSPGLFSGASTVVDISGQGQLLSAATIFQEQLQTLQPGTATSGGGQNFGTDVTSLAAEAQHFIDTFNGLQSSVSNIGATGGLLFGSGLVQSLDAQVQQNFVNGESALTRLSQLGIGFQPDPVTGGGILSIDLDTLKSAFNSDATGAFSLLAKAATALGDTAGIFVRQAASQFSILDTLVQGTGGNGAFSSIFANSLLASGSLAGGANLQQVVLAMNQYALVSTLLG